MSARDSCMFDMGFDMKIVIIKHFKVNELFLQMYLINVNNVSFKKSFTVNKTGKNKNLLFTNKQINL